MLDKCKPGDMVEIYGEIYLVRAIVGSLLNGMGLVYRVDRIISAFRLVPDDRFFEKDIDCGLVNVIKCKKSQVEAIRRIVNEYENLAL